MAQDTATQVNWDEYAVNYDALLKLRPYVHMLGEVAGAVRIGSINSVLDAGCGTGNLLTRLQACRIPEITGMDSSPEMLSRAKGKGLRVKFVHADLNAHLPFPDKTFEAITCVNALYAAENPGSTLAEFARIVAPGGMLVVVTPKQGYENGLILKAHCESQQPDEYWRNIHADPEREESLMREALQDEETFLQIRSVTEINRRISHDAKFHFFTRSELQTLVRNAGFHIVDHRETYAFQSHLLVARQP